MTRRAPLARKTPLKARAARLRQGARLPAMSRRRRDDLPARRAVVALVHVRDRTCRAAAAPGPCRGPLDAHEIIPRSAWAAGWLDAGNVVLVCRAHHDWIGAHPSEAHRLGLHGWSWEVPA